MIYILSCEKTENGGGIYAYELTEKGTLEKCAYFPCDRPMYAVKCEKGLCVLLRQPFENSDESGYFFVDENLQAATQIQGTKGKCACHLCVDNRDVYIVNYLSGNIVKNGLQVVQRTGKSTHRTRQTDPHTHFVDKTPDGYLAVCDLGTDTLAIYDKNLTLISESRVPLGYGVRHMVFSKDGKYIYAVNELVPSVSVFAYDKGEISYLKTIKVVCKNGNASGAAIRLSEDGTHLYASLREENCILVYKIDGAQVEQTQKTSCGGDGPRDFNTCGNYLVCTNEKSGNVTVFSVENHVIVKKTDDIKIPKALCCF